MHQRDRRGCMFPVPLMLDMNNWKTVNWSEKAREYQMGGKGEVAQHLCTRLVIFITRL